jgi:hypothetical protein
LATRAAESPRDAQENSMPQPHDEALEWSRLDRQALLMDAARALDRRESHLGAGSGTPAETSEGRALRAFVEDKAKFGGAPLIHKLAESDFTEAGRKVPARFRTLCERYDFYEIHLPIVLAPQGDYGFNKLKAMVEFNPDSTDPYSRPKAYEILPKSAFQELAKGSMNLEVGLNENFELEAKPTSVAVPAGIPGVKVEAGAGAKLSGGMSMTMGPFNYRLRKATIQHNAPGSEEVWWTIDDAELLAGDEPLLFVIAQVPKTTKELRLRADLLAYRRFVWLKAGLQSAIKQLSKEIQQFFKAGAPISDSKDWDLSHAL